MKQRSLNLPVLIFSATLIAGCGGSSSSDDNDNGANDNSGDNGNTGDNGSSNGTSIGCINSNFSDGAYFIGSFTGIESDSQITEFNATNIDTGCGGLGFGTGYSIVFSLADPGDPNGADLNFVIDIADDAIPQVGSDQAASITLTLPGSDNPARGGFFNGTDCFVSITAVPEEPNQQGGRLFYPEGTFTCSSFTLDPSSAAAIGPQGDILISPSSSDVQFLGAVGITNL